MPPTPTMDIAQIFGDYIHLLAMIVLLAKLLLTRNCSGISGKTQLLNALVFTTRYTNLTFKYISLYDTALKVVYISLTYLTVVSIFFFFRQTYDRKRDAFRIELLILPCAVFALFTSTHFDSGTVLWTFSTYLESVAIVPQVYLVSKSKQIESVIISYVACMGLYRGCYITHHVYIYWRYVLFDRVDVGCSVVQLLFYVDLLARNLPILKPKNAAQPVLPRHQPAKDTASVVVRVDVKSAAAPKPAIPEKVTLLTCKEQGTSN